MRVVVAPDKFKGTATAREMSAGIAGALERGGHEVRQVPMADGGDGTLDALGGANRTTTVTGPLGHPVEASWRLSQGVAVIEMAVASGLVLTGGAEGNDPLNASTRGTGELIAAAVARGAKRIIVGLGGSATTDGGLGAVEAIGSRARLSGVELEVAADVTTLFTDAARIFGPQKGATAAQVAFLEARLRGLAERYRDDFGVDVESVEGAGAAGGLGGGLLALGGRITSGFELVADELGLFEAIEWADLVATGEGRLDAESFAGEMAADTKTRLLVVAGTIAGPLPESALGLGRAAISLSDRFGERASIADPVARSAEAVTEFLQ